LTFLVAVLVLAVGARQAGIWPTSLTVALFGLILLPIAFFGTMMFLPWYAMREAGVAVLVLFAPLAGIWLVIGAGLLRGFLRPAEA
jgi:hypothetical protein